MSEIYQAPTIPDTPTVAVEGKALMDNFNR